MKKLVASALKVNGDGSFLKVNNQAEKRGQCGRAAICTVLFFVCHFGTPCAFLDDNMMINLWKTISSAACGPDFGHIKPGAFAPGLLCYWGIISMSQSAHLMLTVLVALTLLRQQGQMYLMLWLLGFRVGAVPVALPLPLPRGI